MKRTTCAKPDALQLVTKMKTLIVILIIALTFAFIAYQAFKTRKCAKCGNMVKSRKLELNKQTNEVYNICDKCGTRVGTHVYAGGAGL